MRYHDEVSGAEGVINVLPPSPEAIAVEYYNVYWNFYFLTAFPDEIAALDAGAYAGLWKRTGLTFNVWTDDTTGDLPTCRFFSDAFGGKSTHFYTPYAGECAAIKANSVWQYEGIAFYMQVPDASGNCPMETSPLYRAYNNGMAGAPNHRYTTSVMILNRMLLQGWQAEGAPGTRVFACVPAH